MREEYTPSPWHDFAEPYRELPRNVEDRIARAEAQILGGLFVYFWLTITAIAGAVAFLCWWMKPE